MPDDDAAAVAAEPESNSDDAVSDPEGSDPEGQGDGNDEPTGDPEGESEADDGSEADSDGAENADAQGDEDPDEYKNLVKKFAHLTNERDVKAAIGKTFWEKTRYASQVRKENEELKLQLARLEGAQPKKDEPPPPPPPDLKKAIDKIETLYQRNQQVEVRRGEIIKELNAADRELAIAEDRLKDLEEGDERRPLAHQRVRQAKLELEAAKDRYGRVIDTMETLSDRMEQALAEKDWIERFHKDQAQRQTSEQKRHEQFNAEFPAQVEALTKAAAAHVELKLDDRLQQSLWRHVNRALQTDIRGQYLDAPVEEIPIPDMVLNYVKEWAEDHDLVRRKTFAQTSKDKLAVARPAGKPGDKAPRPAAKPAPASSRPAVSPALLSRDSSPAMSRARKILVERFG